MGKMLKDDFAQHCYPNPPWALEENTDNTFLETKIHCMQDQVVCSHYNKNGTESYYKLPFYKLTNANTYTPKHVKMGTLIGELKRMRGNCTTAQAYMISIIQRLPEFLYFANIPLKWVTSALMRLHRTTKLEEYYILSKSLPRIVRCTC